MKPSKRAQTPNSEASKSYAFQSKWSDAPKLLWVAAITLCLTGTLARAQQSYIWDNFAGVAGVSGTAKGTGSFDPYLPSSPEGIAVDSSGNLYVGDIDTIWKVTPDGSETALAGGVSIGYGPANGAGSTAMFQGPLGVAVSSSGNVYVAQAYSGTILKITPAGVCTTLAGAYIANSNFFRWKRRWDRLCR